ncbi:hypothetical protein AYY18_13380 [Morganella psychrotolerans]|uniref:Uncharacterized protein n=1 Tax=Morganella psychrotolerans TaxID=368603 RepID=A0A1B8HU02_9GAMM|nr:hypothetical protein AYY18_13380 [Morganella psychrotolerans]
MLLSLVFYLYTGRLAGVSDDYQLPAVIIRKSQYCLRIISKTVFPRFQAKKSRTCVLLIRIRLL